MEKYNLKDSTSGLNLLQFTEDLLNEFYSSLSDDIWSNWSDYKEKYFSSMFGKLYFFKNKFMIENMDELELLEKILGKEIDVFKE